MQIDLASTRVHTLGVSGDFCIRSPEWKFLYTLCIRIRVDARICIFLYTLTSQYQNQSFSARDFPKWRQAETLCSMLLGLLSSLIACLKLNVAMLNLNFNYLRTRLSIMRLLAISDSGIRRQRLLKRAGRQLARPRRFWVQPGRTSAWWDILVGGIMIEEEWRENFRMSRGSLYKLADELSLYIEGKQTIMRTPVDVIKQVAVTLYYLSDEGRLQKTANAFGISRQVVSKIVRKVCKAITVNLGKKYIKLPFTEEEVTNLVKKRHYINRKSHYTLKVQAACHYKYCFMMSDALYYEGILKRWLQSSRAVLRHDTMPVTYGD